MIKSSDEIRYTYRYRVKNLAGELNRLARAANLVWNYANDAQKHAVKWRRKWPTYFDLTNLTAGSSKELGLHADAISMVCKEYEKSRRRSGKPWLRYRGRRSLGWIPLRAATLAVKEGGFQFQKKIYRVFNPRNLPVGARLTDGSSFAQDASGNWYLNVCFAVPKSPVADGGKQVGIDLGLKSLAALDDGRKIEHPRFYRQMEMRLGIAARANKRRQLKRLHAKCANARQDYIHKATTALAKEYNYVAIGDVPSSRLGRTRMAKSIYDAGWAIFKNQLRYKTIALGGTFVEVDESLTSQLCSACGSLPASRPRGIADVGIRQWSCSICGAHHDRDVNAARNILARSRHGSLAEGAVQARRCRPDNIQESANP